MNKETLRMERVTYVEHGVMLLRNFNFQIFSGEVMGLVSIDSFNVDAFIQLLQLNRPILFGNIYINERLVNTYHRNIHMTSNVQVISDESSLVNNLSIAENVFILRHGYRGILVRNKMMEQQIQNILRELELDLPPDIPPSKMTFFQRYVIEIIKAVISMPDIIVLKDPGAVINQNNMNQLHRIIHYYAQKGYTFIYISVHREELVRVCNRISMMANGHIVKVFEKNELTEEMMSCYSISPLAVHTSKNEENDNRERVLQCNNLYYNHLNGLSFYVNRGECIVMHDQENAISEDLIHVLTSERTYKGISWTGQEQKGKRGRRKIAVIMENPASTMLYNSMSCEDNACLTVDHLLPGLWRRKKVRRKITKAILGVETGEFAGDIRELSLHQKYTLVYGRVFIQRPEVVFCVRPFLNTDMELRKHIQALIRKFLEHDMAVVILNVNYKDTLCLANRLLMIRDGREQMILSRAEFAHLIDAGEVNS